MGRVTVEQEGEHHDPVDRANEDDESEHAAERERRCPARVRVPGDGEAEEEREQEEAVGVCHAGLARRVVEEVGPGEHGDEREGDDPVRKMPAQYAAQENEAGHGIDDRRQRDRVVVGPGVAIGGQRETPCRGVREKEERRPQHCRATGHFEDGVAALGAVQRNLAREVRRRVATKPKDRS